MMSGQKVSHAKLEYEILCKTFEEEAELFAFFMKENYIARFKLVSDPIRFLEGGPIYYLYKDKTIGVCTPKYCINNKGITVENFKKIYYNMKNERVRNYIENL